MLPRQIKHTASPLQRTVA